MTQYTHTALLSRKVNAKILSLTQSAPSDPKLHIAKGPSNYSKLLIKMVTKVDLGTLLGCRLKCGAEIDNMQCKDCSYKKDKKSEI